VQCILRRFTSLPAKQAFHFVSPRYMPCRVKVCYSRWMFRETNCTTDTLAHTSPVLIPVAQFKLIS